MKFFVRRNVRKHRDIKGSEDYVTLDITLKFESLENMRITFLESKEVLGGSGKGLITSMGFKAKVRQNKYKQARYTIRNVSKKNLSKIVRYFDKLPYKSYERRRPNHEPADSYCYLCVLFSVSGPVGMPKL